LLYAQGYHACVQIRKVAPRVSNGTTNPVTYWVFTGPR
jgi:hypothetical protein